MARKLLVTGVGGFVGGSIVAQAGDLWEVHALSRRAPMAERPNLHWHVLDALDGEALAACVREIHPAVVVHAGANADIDFCEAHQDEAHRVNVEWTTCMAELAEEVEARMVYLSTDNAFDGGRGLYTEEDTPAPVNYYGVTKVAGEAVVAALDVPWVIARVAIVMGLPMLGDGNSFLSRILAAYAKEGPVGVPPNEIRTPVDVVSLGRAILELAENRFTGIVHLAGDDVVHRCDLVRHIARRLGLDPDRVVPNDPTGLPGRGPRPIDVSLSNKKARSILRTPLPGVDGGMDLTLAHRR